MSTPPLIGTYSPPRVKTGEVVTCLYRAAECVVTGFTDAPIRWPRVLVRGRTGTPGLWVTESLARAIRDETGPALMYWFGVSSGMVWKWRRWYTAADPSPAGGPGQATPPWMRPWWTAEETALLGTDRDEVIAGRIGRTPAAVEQRRAKLKIPAFGDRRFCRGQRPGDGGPGKGDRRPKG